VKSRPWSSSLLGWSEQRNEAAAMWGGIPHDFASPTSENSKILERMSMKVGGCASHGFFRGSLHDIFAQSIAW
jgi:hypothetical protein